MPKSTLAGTRIATLMIERMMMVMLWLVGTAIAVVLCVALLMGIIVLIVGAVGLLARR